MHRDLSMLKKALLPLALFSLLLAGCAKPHLDIFPELSDPELVNKKLSTQKLHQDIDAFYQGVLERHPDLEKYASKVEIKRQIKKLKQEISVPMTRTDFYRIVGKLSHSFNDGHTFLIWPYQEYSALKEKGEKPFPFSVAFNKRGVFIAQDYSSESMTIKKGSRLIEVNGIPIGELFDELQKYTGGETDILRRHIVAERFAPMLWGAYGFINDFNIKLERGGETREMRISKNQDWRLVEQENQRSEEFFYSKLNDSTGYLYIETFDVDVDWFEDFIDDTFETINSNTIKKLIIDIRSNTGGNTDSAAYLTSYLTKQPVKMVSSVKEKLNQENRGLFNYKGEAGEFVEQDWNEFIEPQNEDIRFKGKVYLLVSPLSYSSAIVFATTLKDNQLATLVGQETGGFANQTGQGNLFNLPNSQLRVYVATKLLVRPSGNKKVIGVVPDILVEASKNEVEKGIDSELHVALKH